MTGLRIQPTFHIVESEFVHDQQHQVLEAFDPVTGRQLFDLNSINRGGVE